MAPMRHRPIPGQLTDTRGLITARFLRRWTGAEPPIDPQFRPRRPQATEQRRKVCPARFGLVLMGGFVNDASSEIPGRERHHVHTADKQTECVPGDENWLSQLGCGLLKFSSNAVLMASSVEARRKLTGKAQERRKTMDNE
ncbi:hypothetical protein Q1695_010775 [Nippostrongylus brasiliensis]|nr:hypothetical protein Q1695_010775 [Nippostrongylus brasiliensis]